MANTSNLDKFQLKELGKLEDCRRFSNEVNVVVTYKIIHTHYNQYLGLAMRFMDDWPTSQVDERQANA